MEFDHPSLRECTLFRGIHRDALKGLLICMGARSVTALKGEYIFCEGDRAELVGIVLSGAVHIVRDDYYGSRSILGLIGPGGIFGESFAYADVRTFPVSIVAAEDSEVMLIEGDRITTPCSNACSYHSTLIQNMLRVVAGKNILLNRKIDITSRRTTREKLMAYLLSQAKEQGSDIFTIPYDRQALADFLEVDRSAMSSEIGKLKKDGIIDVQKSTFKLLGK